MKKFLIKVNGTQYEVEVEEVKTQAALEQQPVKEAVQTAASAAAPAPAPKPAENKKSNTVPSGASTITAPMPGTILKVNVNPGDVVSQGQVLLVLEAMKMENEIVAPNAGTVASVNVAKGDSVQVGAVMVSIA